MSAQDQGQTVAYVRFSRPTRTPPARSPRSARCRRDLIDMTSGGSRAERAALSPWPGTVARDRGTSTPVDGTHGPSPSGQPWSAGTTRCASLRPGAQTPQPGCSTSAPSPRRRRRGRGRGALRCPCRGLYRPCSVSGRPPREDVITDDGHRNAGFSGPSNLQPWRDVTSSHQSRPRSLGAPCPSFKTSRTI